MEVAIWSTLIGFTIAAVFFGLFVVPAAYRNGVTDGYGYSQEPTCPGYRAAGEFLRSRMAYRWPELRDRRRS